MTDTNDADDRTRTAFQVMNEIGIIEQLGRTQFERVLPDGLKLPHLTVLNHFVRLGGERTPQDLARSFQVTKGTMTNTLQKLEARGLIAIRPNPEDGRSKIVSLTDAGRQLHGQSVAALEPHLERLIGKIDPSQFQEALPFLRLLRETLDTDPFRNRQPGSDGD